MLPERLCTDAVAAGLGTDGTFDFPAVCSIKAPHNNVVRGVSFYREIDGDNQRQARFCGPRHGANDFAWDGCSWRNTLPWSACFLYSLTMNLMCSIHSFRVISLFSVLGLSDWSWLNGVHGGLPISTSGCSRSIYASAMSLWSLRVKIPPIGQVPSLSWSQPKLLGFQGDPWW